MAKLVILTDADLDEAATKGLIDAGHDVVVLHPRKASIAALLKGLGAELPAAEEAPAPAEEAPAEEPAEETPAPEEGSPDEVKQEGWALSGHAVHAITTTAVTTPTLFVPVLEHAGLHHVYTIGDTKFGFWADADAPATMLMLEHEGKPVSLIAKVVEDAKLQAPVFALPR